MGMPAESRGRWSRRAAGLAVGMTLALVHPMAAMASTPMETVMCSGPTTVTFATPIYAQPDPATNTVTWTGSGSCTGLVTGTGSWMLTGTAQAGTACTGGIAAVDGSGTITLPSPVGGNAVSVQAGGTAAASAAAFASPGVVPKVAGSGAFAWSGPLEMAACAGGISTISTLGVLVMVA
jgi:hypothetical protein